jgi:hypothetical protein
MKVPGAIELFEFGKLHGIEYFLTQFFSIIKLNSRPSSRGFVY